MSYPVLYSFRRCPYAIRARLALASANISCELREVALRNKPAEMLALSPKGTVPVLQLADNSVIEESRDIMRWALSRHDPEGWLSANRAATEALIDDNDEHFKPRLDAYKYHLHHPQQTVTELRQQCLPMLTRLDECLRTHAGKALLGKQKTLADYALLPFVRQFAAVDRSHFESLKLPGLQNWLKSFEDSPVFLQVMKKHPPWSSGDTPTLWPEHGHNIRATD